APYRSPARSEYRPERPAAASLFPDDENSTAGSWQPIHSQEPLNLALPRRAYGESPVRAPPKASQSPAEEEWFRFAFDPRAAGRQLLLLATPCAASCCVSGDSACRSYPAGTARTDAPPAAPACSLHKAGASIQPGSAPRCSRESTCRSVPALPRCV